MAACGLCDSLLHFCPFRKLHWNSSKSTRGFSTDSHGPCLRFHFILSFKVSSSSSALALLLNHIAEKLIPEKKQQAKKDEWIRCLWLISFPKALNGLPNTNQGFHNKRMGYSGLLAFRQSLGYHIQVPTIWFYQGRQFTQNMKSFGTGFFISQYLKWENTIHLFGALEVFLSWRIQCYISISTEIVSGGSKAKKERKIELVKLNSRMQATEILGK